MTQAQGHLVGRHVVFAEQFRRAALRDAVRDRHAFHVVFRLRIP